MHRSEQTRRAALLLARLAPMALAAAALGDPVPFYSRDFEAGPAGSAWVGSPPTDSAAPFTRFAGRVGGNDGLTLGMAIPSGGVSGTGQRELYSLVFDFYAIDSWDGSAAAYGADYFEVRINDRIYFSETIANTHEYQSYRRPDMGPVNMGFGAPADSIYRDIRIDFELPSATSMWIDFRGILTQPINDESWGIDNVRLSYTLVPAPGSTALALAAIGLIGRRRRGASKAV